jgi:hypothetical protein
LAAVAGAFGPPDVVNIRFPAESDKIECMEALRIPFPGMNPYLE